MAKSKMIREKMGSETVMTTNRPMLRTKAIDPTESIFRMQHAMCWKLLDDRNWVQASWIALMQRVRRKHRELSQLEERCGSNLLPV